MSKQQQRTSYDDYKEHLIPDETAAGRLGHGSIEYLPPSKGYDVPDEATGDAKTWTGDQSAFE